MLFYKGKKENCKSVLINLIKLNIRYFSQKFVNFAFNFKNINHNI